MNNPNTLGTLLQHFEHRDYVGMELNVYHYLALKTPSADALEALYRLNDLYLENPALLGSGAPLGLSPALRLALGTPLLGDGSGDSYALLLLAIALAFTLVALLAFLARSAGTSFTAIALAKQAPYECGFQPFEKLDRCSLFLFYRLAVFFIIFEAELIFLYPWVTAIALRGGDLVFFAAALPFLGLLLLGFAWEMERGALSL